MPCRIRRRGGGKATTRELGSLGKIAQARAMMRSNVPGSSSGPAPTARAAATSSLATGSAARSAAMRSLSSGSRSSSAKAARSRKRETSSSVASVRQLRRQRARSDDQSGNSSRSSSVRLIARFSSLIYVDRIAAIPATLRFYPSAVTRAAARLSRVVESRSFLLGPEIGAQLDHRLVVRAAHGLRVDAERRGDFGNLHLAIIQLLQNFVLPRRQQCVRQLELLCGLDRVDSQSALGYGVDVHQDGPVPPHGIASGAARDYRNPRGQSGSRGVVAAQESEIILAQAEKDLLRQILDLRCLARYTAYGRGNEAGIAPHKRFPRPLVPARERVQLASLRQSGCLILLVGGCGRRISASPSALNRAR